MTPSVGGDSRRYNSLCFAFTASAHSLSARQPEIVTEASAPMTPTTQLMAVSCHAAAPAPTVQTPLTVAIRMVRFMTTASLT